MLVPLLLLVTSVDGIGKLRAAEPVDFGRDIRPILSDKCFQCHGVDDGTRHADLRLDLRDAAIADRDGISAIVPHHPEMSLILARILATDESEKMPPSDSNKHLTAEQIELIRNWIQQGAEYTDHWAFEPVRQPEVPRVDSPHPVRNEIDAFILQRLARQGLTPSPEADRVTLIRRLSQDLIGLLPTPAETTAFVKDSAPDAYEQLVERLLASPHYGERWGRHWLDQARYADSHGFTIDGPRVMWPYRDWVIQAVCDDIPFNQFTIEQLAGDLLPNPTKSQLVATGFHRNTMINQEGGVKPDQYRHEAIIDRVNTTGAVWMGLTIGCAQCHSHKFDPVTHDDYYRLYGFFNRCVDANNNGPTVDVLQQEMFGLTADQKADLHRLQALRKRLKTLEQQEKDRQEQANSQNLTGGPEWNWIPATVTDVATASNATFQRLPDGSFLSDRNGAESDTYRVTLEIPGGQVRAIRVRTLPHPTLPKNGPGLAGNGNFVLTEAMLEVDGRTIPFVDAIADHEQPGFPAVHVFDRDEKTGWAINIGPDQKKKSPEVVMNAPHEIVLILNQASTVGVGETVTLLLGHHHPRSYVIGRFAIDVSSIIPIQNPMRNSDTLKSQQAAISELEAKLPGRGREEPQMILQDQEKFPLTYRLDRGDFLQPDLKQGPLEPGVPSVLIRHLSQPPQFDNRLDLAHWLVSRENPLTSRVTVNRVWMRYFGRGLVETENDFGYQSSPPTHPELLDWLAWSFMENGWSMKSLHRTIVNSATYRQSSDVRADVMAIDPRNLLLAQQSRFRVEAEIVRDQALSASGRLTPVIGGPSVHPPQPDGVYSFTQNKKSWPESRGPDRYRRTMYTMLYRSAPHPLLSTFDSPDFSTVCTQRPRSNTPLQSLTLANDVIFIELAQGLAQRVFTELPADADRTTRITFLFQLCLTRLPTEKEQQILERYWLAEQARYQTDSSAGARLAPTELFPEIPVSDAAAWVSLARVLMNTDEFVTRN